MRVCDGNDVQYAADLDSVIECPKSTIGRVIGRDGATIRALEQKFAANIKLNQTQDPVIITIAGEAAAVGDAATAVRRIITGGERYTGGPDARASGLRGPAGGFNGASSITHKSLVHDSSSGSLSNTCRSSHGACLFHPSATQSLQSQRDSLPGSHIAQRRFQCTKLTELIADTMLCLTPHR